MAKPYGPQVTTKEECVGHIAKCLYSRMKYLCQKGAVDDRGAKVLFTGSKGPHKKRMRAMGTFHKGTIMSNVGDVDGMANDTMAIFYHCSSTDRKPSASALYKGRIFTWCNCNKWMQTKTQKFHTNEPAPIHKKKNTQMLQNISK